MVETIPQAPPQYRPQPTPAPPAYRTERTPPPPPAPVYRNQPEPVLPAIFRGCWEGRVAFLDAIKRVPGGAKIGPWTPKTYRLCYRKVGDGPFQLTFTDAGVAHNRRITAARGRMQLISTDGRTYATMRAYLHFDEYRGRGRFLSGDTFPVDEVTDLKCDIERDGMHVSGAVYGSHGGNPWFRAWWHATFIHVAEAPQTAPAGGIPE